MSQENVEVSRRALEHFNEREMDAWWSFVDEKVEWHSRADEPDAGVYCGKESFRRYVDSWIEMFPNFRLELAEDSIDLGDQVATEMLLVGNARASGIEVREPYSFLFTIVSRRIAVCREFRDNSEALKAAGIEE
jgi:ketosteroid isomerase-like protein